MAVGTGDKIAPVTLPEGGIATTPPILTKIATMQGVVRINLVSAIRPVRP